MIRVLIADDSKLVRSLLCDLLTQDPEISIAAEVDNGRKAVLETSRLRPDLVIMDIQMPEMDGLTAVAEIMSRCPTPILVLSANLNPQENSTAFQAINRGALDVMEKPAGLGRAVLHDFAPKLIAEVKFLARIRVLRHYRRERTVPVTEIEAARVGGGTRDILAIGASTGGPRAVQQLLKALDPASGVRVLIVQHIAGGFSGDFTHWLDQESRFRVRLARTGDRLEPGVALVAPADRHMTLCNGGIRLTGAPPVHSCRPSIDVLFDSLAETAAAQTVAVLLTGMGRDGAAGMLALRQKGGVTIAQDESSSIIFGMPKAAIDLGGAQHILPLDVLPATLTKLLGR